MFSNNLENSPILNSVLNIINISHKKIPCFVSICNSVAKQLKIFRKNGQTVREKYFSKSMSCVNTAKAAFFLLESKLLIPWT